MVKGVLVALMLVIGLAGCDPETPQVNPGSFCSPEGARGVTENGTQMTCARRGSDQPRWRAQ